jgi:hypothetical protein
MKTIFPEKSIRNMLHCLGISHTRSNDYVQPNKRYNPYPTSYRNYYQISQDDEWDKLVGLGYATFQVNGLNLPYYRVTKEGKKYLKSLGYKWHEKAKL